ncbi:hypothetical protein KJ840_03505 [Patescibacteria group bacterium]|nr:hypothetical protein [Patescibacteria group bacterium]
MENRYFIHFITFLERFFFVLLAATRLPARQEVPKSLGAAKLALGTNHLFMAKHDAPACRSSTLMDVLSDLDLTEQSGKHLLHQL